MNKKTGAGLMGKRCATIVVLLLVASVSLFGQDSSTSPPTKKRSPAPPVHTPAPGVKSAELNGDATKPDTAEGEAAEQAGESPGQTDAQDAKSPGATPASEPTSEPDAAIGGATAAEQDEESVAEQREERPVAPRQGDEPPAEPQQTEPFQVQTEETLFETSPSGVPRWVTYIKSGEYGRLTPSSGGFVGIGFGADRSEAMTSAAVDFAGNVSTEVTAEITEEITESRLNRDEQARISTEIRSQAVLSGMQPAVYTDSDGTWYILYRLTVEQYAQAVEQWLQTVELMTDAARRQELQRLEEARIENDRAIEEQRIAMEQAAAEAELKEREAQLKREARLRRRVERQEFRQQVADVEREYLETSLPPIVLGIDTADPARGRWMIATITDVAEDSAWTNRTSFRLSFPPLLYFELTGALGMPLAESFSFYGTSFSGALRLVNGAGVSTRTALAVGGRILFDPRSLFNDEQAQPEFSYFVTSTIRFPRLLHSTLLLYAGSDRAALGLEWSPFWGFLGRGLVLNAAVDMDLGYADFTALKTPDLDLVVGKAGLGFQPVQAFGLTAYVTTNERLGVDVSLSW